MLTLRKRQPLHPKEALKVFLETCIKTFGPTTGPYQQRYDTYDVYFAGLKLRETR